MSGPISDGVESAVGTVYLEVVGVDATGDNAPRAGNDRYALLHGGVLEVSVLANDIVPASPAAAAAPLPAR